MLTLAGVNDATGKAARIMALETQIAQAHWAAERTRDAIANYNPKTPRRDRDLRAGARLAGDVRRHGGRRRGICFNVNTPTALKGIAALVASQPLDDWKAYLTYHHVHNHAPYLPKAIDDENFAFYGKTLAGTRAAARALAARRRPRQRRARRGHRPGLREAALSAGGQGQDRRARGEPAGRLQGEHREPHVDGARDARQGAREAGGAARPKIGYPGKWKDYSSMTIVPGDVLANARAAELWSWRFDVAKLGKPVDKDEWLITPQTVNAYYYPATNEITFPAAILQPPFFDPNADDAVNYGGIGGVIGHEIGHGFDDQGRLYDATGALNDWWTKADGAAFTKRSDGLVAQYGAFEVAARPQGERTAHARREHRRPRRPGRRLPGLPAVARRQGGAGHRRPHRRPALLPGLRAVWRSKLRDEVLRSQVLSNPHAPALNRVNGSCATWTRGTRRSTYSRGTSCIWRQNSA